MTKASNRDASSETGRRRFLQYMAMVGVGGQVLLRSGNAHAAVDAARSVAAESITWPEMRYRKLGRTGFEASRLVFGCGAALARRPNDALLQAAREAGINVFDVGTRRYYNDAEQNLAPFLKTARDEIFLISKAMTYLDVPPDHDVSVAEAKTAATTWLGLLDESLGELGVEHVDAYYVMGANNPSVIRSEEILAAAATARQAGKITHLGLSTHQNAQRVLEAAIESGAYSLAQIAITPAGWYDWEDKGILSGTAPMVALQPFLAKARDAGIGLIGMKAGRYLAGRKFLGWGKPDAFDEHYDAAFLASGLSAFQRSYAFVLEHGLDGVNADMQTLAHLHENVVATATSDRYFG